MSFASVNPHDPADVIGEWPAADQAEADVKQEAGSNSGGGSQ